MALRLMQSLPTMMVLLVAMAAMLVMEPHLAVAVPDFLGRDGYGPGRHNGGNNEEHRNRSSNGKINNRGVSNGSGNRRIIYNRGHNGSTINTHPGSKPNPSGNKGWKGGRIIIRRIRNRRYRTGDGTGDAGRIPVRGNIHNFHNGGTNDDHQGPNIHPGLIHNRHPQPGKGDQTDFGVRKRGGYGSNRDGGHTSAGRNGGGSRGISHGALNKTRGRNGAHQIPTSGKATGPSSRGSNVTHPGDNNQGNHSSIISGANTSTSNATGPDCKKEGGICGDPKVVGGDGVAFSFYGRRDHDFCLVSDTDLHINAHLIGTRQPGRARDNTWVQALGFVVGRRTLTVAAKRNVSRSHDQADLLEFSYDREPFHLGAAPWASPDSAVTLARTGAANAVRMAVKGTLQVSITVTPVSETANRVHKYGVPEDMDCFAHLDMQFEFYNLSSSVDGVLGQTYRPGFVNSVGGSAVVGGAAQFESSSLLATDCPSSRFSAGAGRVASATGAGFRTVCGSDGLPSGGPRGITCHSR